MFSFLSLSFNYFIVIHKAKGKKLKVCVQSREVKCIGVVR